MVVKYVGWHSNDSFTCEKEYESTITPDGLMVIDDAGVEHIIATDDNEYKTYADDSFFRDNFIFV